MKKIKKNDIINYKENKKGIKEMITKEQAQAASQKALHAFAKDIADDVYFDIAQKSRRGAVQLEKEIDLNNPASYYGTNAWEEACQIGCEVIDNLLTCGYQASYRCTSTRNTYTLGVRVFWGANEDDFLPYDFDEEE